MAKGITTTQSTVKKRLSRKELDNKKQIGYMLYMSGEQQKTIAEHLKVSEKTIVNWAEDGKWKIKRSAATITREELINKTLNGIGIMMDKAIASEDPNFPALANALNQMANTIEKLDKKNNIIHQMETFGLFNKHLIERMSIDKEVTPELIKHINRLQIEFIDGRMNNE